MTQQYSDDANSPPEPWDLNDPTRSGALAVSEADDAPPIAPAPIEQSPSGGGGWTIPFLCAGIALIACCVLIPATDENRRLAYERERLKADLDQLQKQVEVNHDFLKRVGEDSSLAERLAQRQMKMVREGTSILELKGQHTAKPLSPFELVTLPPPPELPPYEPVGGVLSSVCRNAHSRLYLMGAGLLLSAMGLVLGHAPRRE